MRIEDRSGDRKYFTIIPNYVLDHGCAYDHALYVQMKMVAGENSTCWSSRSRLAHQCGMSMRRLDKSIKYLLEQKWIQKLGHRKIKTIGGYQKVVEYRIVDIWGINNNYYADKYKGSAPKTPPLIKGSAQITQKGVHQVPTNKNPINKIKLSNESKGGLLREEVNKVAKSFTIPPNKWKYPKV